MPSSSSSSTHRWGREHLLYLAGHESREYGVPCVLCGCGQYARVEFFLYVETAAYLIGKNAPLVVPEIVDDDEEYLFAVIDKREYAFTEQVVAHHRSLLTFAGHPLHVIFLNEAREHAVRLLVLRLQHIVHLPVGILEFQLPIDYSFIYVFPLFDASCVRYLHRKFAEALLVVTVRLFGHNLLAVYVFFERKECLVRGYGLYQVVGTL